MNEFYSLLSYLKVTVKELTLNRQANAILTIRTPIVTAVVLQFLLLLV